MSRPNILLAATVAVALASFGNSCAVFFSSPSDLLLHLDLLDQATGRPAEIVAGAPWVRPGPDGVSGTSDDVIEGWAIGDADLVLRTGITGFSGSFPPTPTPAAAPISIAEPFGQGLPVAFVVGASAGAPASQPGTPVDPPSLAGVPVIVVAFGDLDGDGYVGITELDGDPLDFAIEEAELDPLGRTMVLAQGGQARGGLYLAAGGPNGAELRMVVGAAAYAGPMHSGYLGGVVPDGPMVMTELPFLPRTDPHRALDFGGAAPAPATPGGLLAVEIEPAYEPDPADPKVGERFTIPVDGSAQTVSLVTGRSGQVLRYGIGEIPDPATFRAASHRALRPGLDDAGRRALYEILQVTVLADDGAGNPTELRVLPLDRLGNVADPAGVANVAISTNGVVRITSPDTDGDPFFEVLTVVDSRGASVFVDDGGVAFDDANTDAILIDDGAVPTAIQVTLPDPDVNNSGLVDATDVGLVSLLSGTRVGDPFFNPDCDLSGDGRIDASDEGIVEDHIGLSIPQP